MRQGQTPKLPGWVRRPPELTPELDVLRAGGQAGPDTSILLDPANDVAYKMIGGAYGVLGAEVLGHCVPRVLDGTRWGIYVREAGVAWLCSQLAPQIRRHPQLQGELSLRVARGIAAHHYVHLVVEAAITEAHGKASYLELLVHHAPRHHPSEEALAEVLLRSEIAVDLDAETQDAIEAALDQVMRQTPEARNSTGENAITSLVDLVNGDLSSKVTVGEFQFRNADRPVPQYLVLEPHLPEPVATSIRQALLG